MQQDRNIGPLEPRAQEYLWGWKLHASRWNGVALGVHGDMLSIASRRNGDVKAQIRKFNRKTTR